MNIETILDAISEGYPHVVVKECKNTPNAFILKYKREVFFKGLWDEINVHCRGLVVDFGNRRVVQHPYEKIFNLGEKGAPEWSEFGDTVYTVEKINGYMAAITYDELLSQHVVTTTGTDWSPFAVNAANMIPQSIYQYTKRHSDRTFIFEVVCKEDRHFIDHAEGVYYLGSRIKGEFGRNHPDFDTFMEERSDVAANCRDVYIPAATIMHKSEVLEKVRHMKHEGIIAWDDNGNEVKLKAPYYLFLKFIAKKTPERLSAILEGDDFQQLGDDFQYLVPALKANKELLIDMDIRQRIDWLKMLIEEGINL